MASQLYPKGAGHILAGDLDFDANTIKCLFYSGSYNSAHEFVSDLTGASIIARSSGLAGKTTTNGVFDANDTTLTSVSGSAFSHIVLYKDTGADASSILIAFYDISSFTPSGRDVTVVWSSSGLFSIA